MTIDSDSEDEEACFGPYAEIPSSLRKLKDSKVRLKMLQSDAYLDFRLSIVSDSLPEGDSYYGQELILSPNLSSTGSLDNSMKSVFACGDPPVVERSELWMHWFRTCSTSHKTCRHLNPRTKLFKPRRLVQLLTNDDCKSFT